MKSITAPYSKRSTRFPTAPPRIRPSIGWRESGKDLYFKTRKTLTAAAKMTKNQEAFFNNPKKVPVFRTCVKEKIFKLISELTGTYARIKNFEILSRIKTETAMLQNAKRFAIAAGKDSNHPFSPNAQDAAKQSPIAL